MELETTQVPSRVGQRNQLSILWNYCTSKENTSSRTRMNLQRYKDEQKNTGENAYGCDLLAQNSKQQNETI